MAQGAGQSRRLFTGEHAYRLDSQRRIALPTAWRGKSDSERSFMLLPHEQPCIQMWPMPLFEKLLPRLEEELLRSADALVAAGSTATLAAETLVDRQGRFSLTSAQLAYARITDRVVLMGGYLTIALWSPELWEATRQAPAAANQMLRSAAARTDDLGQAFRRAMGVPTPP